MGRRDYPPYQHIFRRAATQGAHISQNLDVRCVLCAKGGYNRVGVVQLPLVSAVSVFGATAKGDSFSSFHTWISTA